MDEVKIPRIEAVRLLYNLKHMKTLVEIIEATESETKILIAKSILRLVQESHDGLEFHCKVKD